MYKLVKNTFWVFRAQFFGHEFAYFSCPAFSRYHLRSKLRPVHVSYPVLLVHEPDPTWLHRQTFPDTLDPILDDLKIWFIPKFDFSDTWFLSYLCSTCWHSQRWNYSTCHLFVTFSRNRSSICHLEWALAFSIRQFAKTESLHCSSSACSFARYRIGSLILPRSRN